MTDEVTYPLDLPHAGQRDGDRWWRAARTRQRGDRLGAGHHDLDLHVDGWEFVK